MLQVGQRSGQLVQLFFMACCALGHAPVSAASSPPRACTCPARPRPPVRPLPAGRCSRTSSGRRQTELRGCRWAAGRCPGRETGAAPPCCLPTLARMPAAPARRCQALPMLRSGRRQLWSALLDFPPAPRAHHNPAPPPSTRAGAGGGAGGAGARPAGAVQGGVRGARRPAARAAAGVGAVGLAALRRPCAGLASLRPCSSAHSSAAAAAGSRRPSLGSAVGAPLPAPSSFSCTPASHDPLTSPHPPPAGRAAGTAGAPSAPLWLPA